VVALAREVDIAEGRTMLEVKGDVGVVAVAFVFEGALSGSSHAVWCLVSHLIPASRREGMHIPCWC
jgi:hypothetical protein